MSEVKLWLLTPKENLPDDDNPWKPWYDKCFGMVIREETEERARETATWMSREECNTENYEEIPWIRKEAYANAWKDSRYSDCIELKPEGEPKTILMDVKSA